MVAQYQEAPPEVERRLLDPLTLDEGPEGGQSCHPLREAKEDEE